MRGTVTLLSLATSCLAFQLPFKVPFLQSDSIISSSSPRVAIIGAGAGGSSAAFWVAKAKQRHGLDVDVDVYEAGPYVGGRSTVVYPYNDPVNYAAVELGGSIFVDANRNMHRAAQEFNLSVTDFKGEDGTMGIWDGEKVRFQTTGYGWLDMLKGGLHYGLPSPKRTDTIVSEMVSKFRTLYTPDSPRWDTIESLSEAFGWTELTSTTISDYLLSHGVLSRTWIDEVIEGATRVNYGQDSTTIHALEGLVSMAANGASGIVGGNYQVFEQFIEHSNATLLLNTPVTGISKKGSRWSVQTAEGAKAYTSVILAAPFHSSGITVEDSIASQIPAQPYVHLHVTLLSTSSPGLNPAYIGYKLGRNAPNFLLTTSANVRAGGKAPEFNSISYHGKISDAEWVVKIFSKEKISDEWLSHMFLDKVGWVLRKEWDAYPELPSTTTFPPVKLADGFYYVNAFEPFISTMETETIAARNVVDLLLNEQHNVGLCEKTLSESAERQQVAEQDGSFVLGWDC